MNSDYKDKTHTAVLPCDSPLPRNRLFITKWTAGAIDEGRIMCWSASQWCGIGSSTNSTVNNTCLRAAVETLIHLSCDMTLFIKWDGQCYGVLELMYVFMLHSEIKIKISLKISSFNYELIFVILFQVLSRWKCRTSVHNKHTVQVRDKHSYQIAMCSRTFSQFGVKCVVFDHSTLYAAVLRESQKLFYLGPCQHKKSKI